jgi:16S rRNA (guanine966-N2)-methyltransferase
MRLTGGNLRGRSIPGAVPSGVRPTSSRVREALFSMVGQDLSGWSALDAFGGSGLLGFEAHSRGAAVLIVEQRPRVARQIREAAATLGAPVEVRCADAAAVLASGAVWDLVLLDPPYAEDPGLWLERAAAAVQEVLVLEHDASNDPPDAAGPLRLERRRRYGDTTLSLYRPEDG